MDQEKFTTTLNPLTSSLHQMTFSILKEENAAKDHLQELYIKLWEKREEPEKIRNIKNYALKAIRNLCLDSLRKEVAFHELTVDIPPKGPDSLEIIAQKSVTQLIARMVGHLPEIQGNILRLRDIEGMEISEIAFVMSIYIPDPELAVEYANNYFSKTSSILKNNLSVLNKISVISAKGEPDEPTE